MQIGEFTLENPAKVDRVINGTPDRQGLAQGGLGLEKDKKGNITNGAAIIAEYDRIGGYITKDGDKVKTGSFYNFKKGEARVKPKIVLVYRVNGEEVEVPDGMEAPLSVRAAKMAEQGKAEKSTKPKNSNFVEGDDDEDDEEVADLTEEDEEEEEDAPSDDESEDESDEDESDEADEEKEEEVEELTPAQKRAKTRAANAAKKGKK